MNLDLRYIASPPTALINSLVTRNLHLLGLRICQHLSIRPDIVLKHWASAKIARSRGTDAGDDEEICETIVNKFEKEGEKGVSYADIAKKAWEAGRTKLATMVRSDLLIDIKTHISAFGSRDASCGASAVVVANDRGSDSSG